MSAIKVEPGTEQVNLSPKVDYYKDESGQLGLEQVRQLSENNWHPSSANEISFGFTRATYWFRLRVQPQETLPMLIEVGYPSFDRVEMYQISNGQVQQFQTGAKVPIEERAIHSHFPVLPLQLIANESTDIYLRASNSGAFYLPLRLWNWPAYINAGSVTLLGNGIYFGAWLIVIFFNLVLFAVLGHRALLSLSLFIFSFGLYQVSSLGLGSTLVQSMPAAHDDIVIFSVGLATISLGWLADHLLILEKTNPLGRKFIQLIAAVAAGLMISYLFLPYSTIIPWIAALTICNAITVFIVGLHAAIAGNRLGLYATLAWTTLLIGTVIHALNRFAILPSNLAAEHAPATGFIIMILILSLAIASEIRRQRVNLLSDEQQAREKERQRNLELERMVSERTAELEAALRELSDTNEALKELNTVDALTGIKNRHYFDETFEQEWRRASREKYPLSLLLLDIDRFKEVNDTYGHLAGDECLRSIATIIGSHLKRPADILARYGGEEFVILLPYVSNDNAVYLAEQIRTDVASNSFTGDGNTVKVTLSIGVCTHIPDEAEDQNDMINAADMALYDAKDTGRNIVRNAGNLIKDTSRSAG